MAGPSGLTLRPMAPDDDDLGRYVAAFERNDDPKELRQLDWLYRRNPCREVYVDFAVPPGGTNHLAAIYAVSAVRADVDGRTLTGVQSLDTLTDKDFRGQGLFPRLASDVYRRCAEGGVSFVYGFPNAHSAPGFFGKLGWVNLDPVPFLVLPLRASYGLRRLGLPELPWLGSLARPLRRRHPGRGEELRVVQAFGPEFDGLWEAFAAGTGVAVRRDAAYLRWRFSKPGERYKTLGLYRAGELLGFVTFTLKEKHGGRIGYVMECLFRPGEEQGGRALLSAATAELSREGAEVVLAWCLEHSPNRAAYGWAGFLYLPERLRPIELHFGARRLSGDHGAIGNRRSWYLSYCDSDTV